MPIIPAGQFTVKIFKMIKKEALVFLEIFYTRRKKTKPSLIQYCQLEKKKPPKNKCVLFSAMFSEARQM